MANSSPKKEKQSRTTPKVSASIKTFQQFRRAIHSKGELHQGIDAARRKLEPSAIPDIIAELGNTSVYKKALVREPFPPSVLQLKQKRPLSTVSDQVEAAWTSSILALHLPELSRFIELRDNYYDAMALGEHDLAQCFLTTIESELGTSLWVIANRVSLLQTRAGTSAQKTFLRNIMQNKGISGTTAYLSYLFSFAAEDNVSLADLTREWSRQETFHLSHNTIQYFQYHVSAFNFSTVDEPWACVAHEESSSLIDRFETFLEMSALSYIRSDTVESAHYIRDALILLPLPDRRIQNLLALFGDGKPAITQAVNVGSNALSIFTTALETQRSELMDSLDSQPAEFALYELAAKVGLKGGHSIRVKNKDALPNLLIPEYENVIGLNANYYASRFALQKFALIFRKMPVSRAIAAFLDFQDDRFISSTSKENEALWAIAGPADDPQQLPVLKQLNSGSAKTISSKLARLTPLNKLTDAVVFPTTDSDAKICAAPVAESYKSLFRGHLAFNRGDFSTSLGHYSEYENSVRGYERVRAARLIYEAAHALGDLNLALALFTEAYLSDPSVRLAFPLDKIVEWAKDNPGLDATALNRAIALNIYLQHVSPQFDGDLSDAFEDVLESHGVEKPSQLLEKVTTGEEERGRWIYFFREVATIRRLEDGTQLSGYEEIEAERLSILSGLIERCPELAESLTDEVVDLTRAREVAQLAEQFDRSRIYVNEAGVKQFIEVELRDAVTRYRRLLDAPTLQQQIVHLEAILLKILKASGGEFRSITLPATEQEGLLDAIYGLVADSFVLNPDHGLKTYLTTRILHGSIEGELRSSFAKEEIFLSPATEFAFDATWKSRLKVQHSEFASIRAAAIRFAKRVSDAITDLKDKKVRICCKATPDGLFDFAPTLQDIIELRDEVEPLTSADAFAETIIVHLWQKVDHGLEKVRNEIENEFRKRVLQAAEVLRITIANISPDSDATKLNDALTNAITGFQISVDRVTAWFQRSGNAAIKPFAVETAIDVATKLTNSRFPTQPIAPKVVTKQQIRLRGSAFSPLLDILLNCFQNAIEHGAVGGLAPETTVECEPCNGAVRFVVSNQLPAHCDVDELACAVESARSGEKPKDPRSARGTGLREMERILARESPTSPSFFAGISQERRFVVSFAISR